MGLAQGTELFRVGQDSGRQQAEDVAETNASEQAAEIKKLKSQLTELKKENLKTKRLTARSTKDNRVLRKLVLSEQDFHELYRNGYSGQLKVNRDLRQDFQDLRLQLEESDATVRHLHEGFHEALARNNFLEGRNAWYYEAHHGLEAEGLTGPIPDNEDKPPSSGPL